MRALRPRILALSALAVGVAATLFAWHGTARQAEREARLDFSSRANLAANLLERQMQRYTDALYGLQALYHRQAPVTRAEFSRYAGALELHRRFAGVKAVEFIRRVPEEERESFVAEVRGDRSVAPKGYPDFEIRPEGERPEYWVVDFVEPMAGNETVFGYDIRTREAPRLAGERARDSGEPTATGRYRLAQESGTSAGLVIYLPVYATGPQTDARLRRSALVGFVNVVLRVDDLFSGVQGEPILEGMQYKIHDVGPEGAPAGKASAGTVFYGARDGDAEGPAAWPSYVQATWRPLTVAGRQWRVEFRESPRLSPWLQPFPLVVAGAGFGMSILLFGIVYAITRTRGEAVALAHRATSALRSQLSFTQQLLEAMPNPVFYKDRDGRYLGCNRAFEAFVGRPREQVIGKRYRDVAPAEIASHSESFDEPLLAQAGAMTYESTAVDAQGGPVRDILVNKATFLDPGGEIAGIVGSVVDITGRKQLEKETRESVERLRAVIQAAPVAIIARDHDRVISMWNPAAERIFGYKESEVLGTSISLVPPDDRANAASLRDRALAGETVPAHETRRYHRDGHLVDVSMSLAPIYGADGKISGTMVTILDISRRKQAEAALRESESQLRLAMNAAQLGMWDWDCATDRFTGSDGLKVLFGMPADAPAPHYSELQQHVHPDDREHLQATVRHALKSGDDFSAEHRVLWPDGTVHWIATRGQVMRGADGRAQRLIGVTMDLTERKLAEQRIAHMAHHDALTGLPNRVLLRDRIQQAIAQAHRGSSQLAVLFLDLDRFKNINDSLGHQLGDRLLQSVASRILVCVREGDTVSRVGGDEFVIVIPGLESSADASAVAGKILDVLASAFHLHGNDLHVAASIGISLYPADGADAETLMRNADTAMYHAKDSGRGNFQFFTQHMNVAAQQRLTLENALRRALEAGEFDLHYQPLFDLRTNAVTGMEALLRWRRPGAAAPVLPGEFISVAEDSGLIVPIGDWVLGEALRRAKAWQAAGRALSISVNVSANQLARSAFVDHLRGLLQELALDASLVELEVTERVIVEGAGDARQALDEIAALGVGIAIDDFGTGYSGLGYLKRLPIDTVKIDQSFVRDLTEDPDDAAIVTAIVAMSQSLSVDVVAEGIETQAQLAELKRLGCRRGQGFLLARPMTASAATRFLSREALASAD